MLAIDWPITASTRNAEWCLTSTYHYESCASRRITFRSIQINAVSNQLFSFLEFLGQFKTTQLNPTTTSVVWTHATKSPDRGQRCCRLLNWPVVKLNWQSTAETARRTAVPAGITLGGQHAIDFLFARWHHRRQQASMSRTLSLPAETSILPRKFNMLATLRARSFATIEKSSDAPCLFGNTSESTPGA